MAGSDQSKNLSGMLSGIANTLGQGYQGAGEAIGNNIRNVFRPELDLTDPDSITAYIEWGKQSGAISEGQATQMGWQALKAREARDLKVSQGLVRDLSNRKQAAATLEARLAAANAAGDQALAANIQTSLGKISESTAALQQSINNDPNATKLVQDAEVAQYQQLLRQDKMAQMAAAQQEKAEVEQFKAQSNGITAALLTGQLDPENPQHKESLDAIRTNMPEVYENAMKRAKTVAADRKSLKEATGDKGIALLPEEHFADIPGFDYENYKKQHNTHPKIANDNAIRSFHQVQTSKISQGLDADSDVDAPTAAYDLNTTTGRENAISAIGSDLHDMALENPVLADAITKRSKGNSNGRKELANSVLTKMIEDGITINSANIAKYIADNFKAKEGKGKEKSWWEKMWSNDEATTTAAPAETTPAPASKGADEYL